MKSFVVLVSWGFWAIGIMGYIFLDIPYLTDDDAFLYVSGNEWQGGWGFNYAMVIAAGLSILSFIAPDEKR